MSGIFDVLDRIKPQVRHPEAAEQHPEPKPHRELARALVLDNTQVGKTYLTVPLTRAGLQLQQCVTRLTGRLVGAGANNNGQAWTPGDLAFGAPTVANGPLNWLHQERTIIGTLTTAALVETDRQEAASHDGSYIEATSLVWSFLFPQQTRVIAEAADANSAYYSMECLSEQVQCTGVNGCGAMMPYLDAIHGTGKVCDHVRERASQRRYVDPVFLGAAVIVPPVRPGWAGAHLDVMRRASAALETDTHLAEFTSGQEQLAAQILEYVTSEE